jgi:hypothetical protein
VIVAAELHICDESPAATLDEALLAHKSHYKINHCKRKFSDRLFFIYFQQVSKNKELRNSFST